MSNPIFRKGINGKSHVSWPGFERGNNGQYESLLSEPVPEFFSRPGDKIIRGQVDNNAIIVFGRDRSGIGEVDGGYNHEKGVDETNSLSGYSDYMGAGAIDIVVGRGAPFPIQKEGFTLGPLFRTKENITELLAENLSGEIPAGFTAPHPGYAMDAARIYISQMTNMDSNFGIKKNIIKKIDGTIEESTAKLPHSGIMIKADKVRMHAREDLKLVTGGPGEERNSQGETIPIAGGIHLMAQNQVNSQQPIPLGLNLLNCLDETLDRVSTALTIMMRFSTEQAKFNETLAAHKHLSPFYGIECTWSLTGKPHGVKTVVNMFRYVQSEISKEKNNITAIKASYLANTADPRHINSSYNTTN